MKYSATGDREVVLAAEFRSVDGLSRSTLVNRNVTVNGHRTSMRLEPAMWDALDEIGRRERVSVHGLCSLVDGQRSQSSLTAAMRVFILSYFRSAVTEAGHQIAGHGRGGAPSMGELVSSLEAGRP
jgi:predicted DNA-binding ribbon-helix-helix protein